MQKSDNLQLILFIFSEITMLAYWIPLYSIIQKSALYCLWFILFILYSFLKHIFIDHNSSGWIESVNFTRSITGHINIYNTLINLMIQMSNKDHIVYLPCVPLSITPSKSHDIACGLRVRQTIYPQNKHIHEDWLVSKVYL